MENYFATKAPGHLGFTKKSQSQAASCQLHMNKTPVQRNNHHKIQK